MIGLSRLLIIAGIFLIAVGLLVAFAGKIPLLGKLPGDIIIKKENFTFYVPITTSIIISILMSIFLFFLNKQ